MSTHITGKLIMAGDYTEEEQIDPQEPLARVVIVMPRATLREVATLPMYDEVTVIKTAELAALRDKRAYTHVEALQQAKDWMDKNHREGVSTEWFYARFGLLVEFIHHLHPALPAELAKKEAKP